jgi:hypothetical protein
MSHHSPTRAELESNIGRRIHWKDDPPEITGRIVAVEMVNQWLRYRVEWDNAPDWYGTTLSPASKSLEFVD